MYNFFTVLLLLVPIFAQHDPGCKVDLSRLMIPAPVVLDPYNFSFVYPPTENIPGDETINLNTGDSLLVSCPGTVLTIVPMSTAYVTCNENGEMVIDDQTVYFSSLKCANRISVTTRNTTKLCAENSHIMELGYMIGVGLKWLPILEVCFNPITRNTLYAKFLVPKAIRFMDFDWGYIYDQDNIYNLGYSGWTIYGNSKITINAQVGLSYEDNKYLTGVFGRALLTTEKEVFYIAQYDAISMALNTFPHWPKVCFNWNEVDKAVQKYSVKNVKDLDVYTGTYGYVNVLHEQTFEKVTLHLYNEEIKAMPVPGVMWRLVYEPIAKQAVVFLSVNVPFPTLYEEHVICDDISSKISWQPWDEEDMKNVTCGYSYVCTYESFAEKVTYAPKLEVSGLLV